MSLIGKAWRKQEYIPKEKKRLTLKNVKVSHQKLFRRFTNIQNKTEISRSIYLESIWLWISLPKEESRRWEDVIFNHKLRES